MVFALIQPTASARVRVVRLRLLAILVWECYVLHVFQDVRPVCLPLHSLAQVVAISISITHSTTRALLPVRWGTMGSRRQPLAMHV